MRTESENSAKIAGATQGSGRHCGRACRLRSPRPARARHRGRARYRSANAGLPRGRRLPGPPRRRRRRGGRSAAPAPDCVLLDVMLPGRSGFDLCRAIRATSEVPVLFLSARGGDGDKIRDSDSAPTTTSSNPRPRPRSSPGSGPSCAAPAAGAGGGSRDSASSKSTSPPTRR